MVPIVHPVGLLVLVFSAPTSNLAPQRTNVCGQQAWQKVQRKHVGFSILSCINSPKLSDTGIIELFQILRCRI